MMTVKKLFILSGIFLLGACATQQSSPTPDASTEAPYTGSYIKRPSLVVRDIDTSVSLFRDILGFKLSRLDVDAPDSYVYPAYNIPKGTKVMHATFDTDDEKRVLSIVEVKSFPARPKSGVRSSTILVNANGRLDEILTELTAQGYEILPKHKLGKTGTEVGFIDKNGHLIVLYEFPKP